MPEQARRTISLPLLDPHRRGDGVDRSRKSRELAGARPPTFPIDLDLVPTKPRFAVGEQRVGLTQQIEGGDSTLVIGNRLVEGPGERTELVGEGVVTGHQDVGADLFAETGEQGQRGALQRIAAVARLALNCSAVATGESTRSVMAFTAPTGTSCSEPIQATAAASISFTSAPEARIRCVLRRLVEAVAGRDNPEPTTESVGVSSQVGGGKVGSAKSVEAGKIDAAVVTYEPIPGEVDVADGRAGTTPPASGADGQHEVGPASKPGSGVIKRDLGRKGRCRRPDAVDAGAGIGAIGDQHHVDTRMVCDGNANGK